MEREKSTEVLFHHRYATSTPNVRNACHPFSTKDKFEYQYIGAHNGVVRNARELKEEHDKLGYEYVSVQENGAFNDSESLIYDLARYFEGETDQVKAAGTIAFIVVKKDMQGKPLTLFFGHNSGNPLHMKRTEHSLTISSVANGSDDEHVPINTLHMFDYETRTLRTRNMHIALSSYSGGSYNQGWKSNPRSTTPTTKEYNNWTEFLNDDDRFEDAKRSARNTEKTLQEVKERLEAEFNMRPGGHEDIKREILEDNQYNYVGAALTAQIEAGEAREEQSLMDTWITHEQDRQTQADIVEYWTSIRAYGDMLEKVADELYQEGKNISNVLSNAKKEVQGKLPMGFRTPPVKNNTDPRLLPSTVLENNNKELG
jgi:predicted glutamine amidotransferase